MQTQIIDHTFTKESFEELAFSSSKISVVKNASFIQCKVSPGTLTVHSGATLENVLIENMACGDSLMISSDASLQNVVIRGKKPKAIIVQPESRASNATLEGTAIDVSEYWGEITIVGFGKKNVVFDPIRHIAVESAWDKAIDWNAAGIGPFSYLRLFLKKLDVFGAFEGVFSLPQKNHKHYKTTMDEIRKAAELGINFGDWRLTS